DTYSSGKLDAAGNFIPEPRWMNIGGEVSGAPPIARTLNRRVPDGEPVYEYRSGRLIKGILDAQGNFVPDLGSKVIDFRDYRYNERAIRIYNLPGRFAVRS